MRLIQQHNRIPLDWTFPPYANTPEPGLGDDQIVTEEVACLTAKLANVYRVLYAEPGTYSLSTSTIDYASLRNFQAIRSLIEDLRNGPAEDDLGQLRPSEEALALALQRLYALCATTTVPIPEDVSTDHDGAIRVEWRRNGKFLELVVPSELQTQPFVYHSHGPDFGLTHNIWELRRWLKWLRA